MTSQENVCLPKLRTLEFAGVCIGGDCMEKLLNGCPALESLSLDECNLEMETISFLNLKKLAVMFCSFQPSVSISAAVLESLSFAREMGPGIKLVDMCNVTNVNIEELGYDEAGIGYNLQRFSSISSIENLVITGSYFEYPPLERDVVRCGIFHNLKKLTLSNWCTLCYSYLLPSFLSHCPNLEVLTLTHTYRDCQDWDIEEEEDRIESFDCKHLKRINILYTDYRHEDRLVGLLLRSIRAVPHVQIILTKI